MITHRTSMRSAVAALGVGAAIALTVSSPAFAANEGTYQGNWGGCTATEEIQVQYVNGGYHDQMKSVVWTSTGAGSGWRDDGPGNYMCPQIHDKVTGVLKWQGVCN
jgi:hypothetical protein